MSDILEVIEKCSISRERRRERYNWLRLWYQRGTDQAGPAARYNRLQPHIDRLTSFLYSPEGTRFFIHLPPNDRDNWLHALDPARDEFLASWRDSAADMTYAVATEMALVYGLSALKLIPGPNHTVHVAYVDPGSLGVISEYLPSLDQQDAFVHWFVLTIPEVELLTRGLPDQKDILEHAESQMVQEPPTGAMYPKVIQQVIVSSVASSQVQGTLSIGQIGDDRSENAEPIVELAEVWKKEDWRVKDKKGKTIHEFRDYEVTTVLGQRELFSRRNPVLPWTPDGWASENPFVPVVPRPMADYFWGGSEIAPLVQLQAWREDLMLKIDGLLARQLDPPKFFSGVTLQEEKLKVLSSPGGFVANPMPGAKMDVLKPDMPEQAFQSVREIDRMFDEASGIPEILSGQNVEGVRAGTQTKELAGIAVGRIRKRALVVEDSLEVLATRKFHLMQRLDPTKYPSAKGPFLLGQIPPSARVKVSAHTSSPIYREQVQQKAEVLRKAGAIDLPTFVELMDPPGMEALKVTAKGLEAAQAEFKRKLLEIQLAKAQRKGR